jgi:hypothetical protein
MPTETAAVAWPTFDDVRRYDAMLTAKWKTETFPGFGLQTSAVINWFLQLLRDEGRLNTTGGQVVEEWAILSEGCHVYRVTGAARAAAERELYMLRLGNDESPGEPNARLLRRFVIRSPDGCPLATEWTPWRIVPTPGDPDCAPPERIIDRSTKP